MVLYPEAYGTKMTTLDGMIAKHGGKMHPEFRRRFFGYIESKNGLLGVGGGFRTTQPSKPGLAPPDWSLHTFISGEPWHVQCIEMRGWGAWSNAGRPDPPVADLPNELLPGADMFQPIQPIRNSDTRAYGTALSPGEPQTFGLAPAIPADAVAVALNVTVINPTNPGYLVVWPSGPTPPTATVNFAPGEVINGSAIIGVKDSNFNIEIVGSAAHVTVDVTGYWTSAE